MHPSDDIRGIKSKMLSKKKIVLGVTGSVAAVECLKLSRELIRHDAEVIPVMTPSATQIIHPNTLEFATGNKPIIELTGKTEHVFFCGKVKKPADILLISPCTANTISKIAHGIDDTSVTTFATTAIGSNIPVLIVPAMHPSMYNNKIIQENIKKCKKSGINFITPTVTKNKAKMPNIGEIIASTIRKIGKRDLINKKILIIGGSTAESIDEIRVIVNRSSGKTAVSLAKNAFFRGANIELWYGWNNEPVPSYIRSVDFESINDIIKLLKNINTEKFDVIILCAALADYIPTKQKGKIPSGKKKLNLEMSSAPKIISKLKKIAPKSRVIGFKVEENKDKLIIKAHELLKKNNLDFVIANTISGFNSDKNEIWIINKKGAAIHKKERKEILTNHILDLVK